MMQRSPATQYPHQHQSPLGLLLVGILAVGLMGAGPRPREFDQQPELLLAQKVYKGFQEEEPGCDFRFMRGWFVWYVDTAYVCHTFPVNSQVEADRRAQEILEHSFSVIISGYGLGT